MRRASSHASSPLAWLLGGLLLVAGCQATTPADEMNSLTPGGAHASSSASATPAETVPLERFEFGGDFILTDQTSQPFSLAEHRGKVALLFFGFTLCPDACPLTLSKIAQALELLGPAGAEVDVLFVTVDVERDTPDVLASYVGKFGVKVVGLTGTREQVDAVVAQYRATYEITPSDSAGGPMVNHTTYTYLIDRSGDVRLLFRQSDSAATIAAGIRAALAEATPS